MKLIATLIATMFAFSVYATEATKPAGPEKAPDGMLLAKKKDHTNDNKSAGTKSTETQKAAKKKEDTKPAAK
jgi:Spy/CpxP family protein refolding chaperone